MMYCMSRKKDNIINFHLSIFRVFSPASCEDEVKDILLLRRINMLHWLKASHLDAPLDMSNYDIQQVFEQAREGNHNC